MSHQNRVAMMRASNRPHAPAPANVHEIEDLSSISEVVSGASSGSSSSNNNDEALGIAAKDGNTAAAASAKANKKRQHESSRVDMLEAVDEDLKNERRRASEAEKQGTVLRAQVLRLQTELDDCRQRLVHASTRRDATVDQLLDLARLLANNCVNTKLQRDREFETRVRLETNCKRVCRVYFQHECCMPFCDAENAKRLLHRGSIDGTSPGHYMCDEHYSGLCSSTTEDTVKCPACALRLPSGRAILENPGASLENLLVPEDKIEIPKPSLLSNEKRAAEVSKLFGRYLRRLGRTNSALRTPRVTHVTSAEKISQLVDINATMARSESADYDSDLDVDGTRNITRQLRHHALADVVIDLNAEEGNRDDNEDASHVSVDFFDDSNLALPENSN